MGINLKKDNIICPYFVVGGSNRKEKIRSFPGQHRFSIDLLIKDIRQLKALGVNKILLFGVPGKKDELGSQAHKKDNIVSLAVRRIKEGFPHLTVMTDVCLCAYISHGHCGIIREPGTWDRESDNFIDNKKTLVALSKIAVAHAEAGADYVSPSAMAKGQVAAIRRALDENGYRKTKIMGYSAKFASNFYGPFRNAADSAPKFGDRKGYQLDYSDPGSALAEIKEDIDEGADIVMVKPALAYLDIIKSAKLKFDKPIAAYNVSGEYALVKYGAKQGLWDEGEMVKEIIVSIKRAGADYIITYHAKEIAKW
ncbi:MAG: porphobilinogen synthase [Candidatus Omnitrophota bacterium]|nr:porphobilinogen synthase [Candidatus Omnitrophota bacterium]